MQHQGLLVSARLQGRTVFSKRPTRLPAGASHAGLNASVTRTRAGVICRAEEGPKVQLSLHAEGSAEPQPHHGLPSFSRARLVLLTCVLAASVFLDKRAAHAASPNSPSIVTQDKRSKQQRRGVWSAVKSASTAPLHVLDLFLFPDVDEPIRLIRTSKDLTAEIRAAPTIHDAAPQAAEHFAESTAEITDRATLIDTTSSAATVTQSPVVNDADEADLGSHQDAHLNAAALAQLMSTAALSSFHKMAAGLAAASHSLAPAWPAENNALSGLSQLPGALTPRLEGGDSTVLARQLLRGSYALGGLVVAVMAWQLAAAVQGVAVNSVTDADQQSQNKIAAKVASSADTEEQQAVLLTESGVPTAVLKPEAAAPAKLQRTQVVGPYCIRLTSSTTGAAVPATESTSVAVDREQPVEAIDSQQVVGPYCIRPTDTVDSPAGQLLPAALQGSNVVGPFCLIRPDPAAAAAAEVVHEALLAEAAATQARSKGSPADTGLLDVLSQNLAAQKAQELTEVAVAAAAVVATRDKTGEPAAHSSSQALVSELGSWGSELAAEAVREALIAESAAATAAGAAERALTAAHKIEEAVMEEAASLITTVAASSGAAADAALPVGADAATSPTGAEADVRQLAKEAKEAEAAAAMAAMRGAISASTVHTGTLKQQAAMPTVKAPDVLDGTEQDELHALTAEAIAAEAAAAAAADLAANVNQAELVAEAIAAEAAAAAALAAADAVGAAAAADASAGQAAELVKCHLCGPHIVVGPQTGSGSEGVHLSSSVSVSSWVLLPPGDDDAAMAQLTALAAASGHPAIITSTTTAAGTPKRPPPRAAVHDSSDAEAFKDEFASGGVSQSVECSKPAAQGAAGGNSSCSLADALSIASQAQMQAASVAAVQQAQDRLIRLYRARRGAAVAESRACQNQSAAPTPATAVSHVGASDVAAVLASAQPNAAGKVEDSSSTQSLGVVAGEGAENTTQGLPAGSEALPASKSQDTAAATRPGEVEVTFTDTFHNTADSSFDVPIIRASGDPYTALSHVLTSPPCSTSSSSNKDKRKTRDSSSGMKAAVTQADSTSSFEVPVVVEDNTSRVKPPAAALTDSRGSSSPGVSQQLKGFGKKGFSRGGARIIRYYVPLDTSNTTHLFAAATAAPTPTAQRIMPVTSAENSEAESGAFAAVDKPNSTVKPVDSMLHQEQQQDATAHDRVEGHSAIPVEWISTPNSVKREKLQQRAAAILSATEAPTAELSAPVISRYPGGASVQVAHKDMSNKQGTRQFSDVASTAAALLLDEVDQEVAGLLDAAAAAGGGQRLDQELIGAPHDDGVVTNSNDSSSNVDAHLPPGWGSNADGVGRAVISSSSWGDVTAQLAAELENELASLLKSAAIRLDHQDKLAAAPAIPEGPLPSAADIRAAEQTAGAAADHTDGEDSEPFGRYLPYHSAGKGTAAQKQGVAPLD